MSKETFNTGPESQNNANPNHMSQLAEMPDFEQHLKQQTEIPELKYDSIKKVGANFNQALIDMGLSESFSKNAALQRVFERARCDFIRDAANTSALEAGVSFKQNSLQSDFVRNKHNYFNSIRVDGPNQFTVTTSERYEENSYRDAAGINHSASSTTYVLREDGWLFVDGHDGTTSTLADHEQLMRKEHDTFNSQTFTHREYTPDGREARRESKTFTNNFERKNKSYSDDAMLENPIFMRGADGVPNETVILERTGEQTMHVFIEEYDRSKGERRKYVAEEAINGEYGYQDLVLLNHSRDTH